VTETLRLAELLGGLSLVTDLAAKHPVEQALRASAIAARMAQLMSLEREEASQAYYTTLLRFVGCTAPMPEYAVLGGVEEDMRPRGDMTDLANPREAFPFLASLGQGVPPWRRPAVWARVMTSGRAVGETGVRADCEVAARMAHRFQLDERVAEALYQTFERWDGKGGPQGLAGNAMTLPARLGAVAFAAAMFHADGGRESCLDALRRWSGRSLDPALTEVFLGHADQLLESIETGDAWLDALACEPAPQQVVGERRLDEVLRGFADFVDLKSTYLHGHSSGVSALAEGAARACGLPKDQAVGLRRAGLLHDLGRAGVATNIWEKRGPLTTAEWEQVRLHAYHSERILSRSPLLAPLAQLAGMHHERVDGTGYHRGVAASGQSKGTRILAAADVYQALTEDRPHRQALSPEAAARVLESQPGLDREAVAAVLEAAGQRRQRAPSAWPAGLSDREVEILRLLARGQSERLIGEALFIAPSTVHTHVVHIYEKAGVTTRASAALFAMEYGLLSP
jgi:HD-GYP domain-containing protein (c-di-GMP phosphodiesterase class II)